MGCLLAVLVLASTPPAGIRLIQAPKPEARLTLDLPLLDVPFNFTSGYNWPSPQSYGWLLGNPWLDAKASFRLGLTVAI